jgi:hypothetical protein
MNTSEVNANANSKGFFTKVLEMDTDTKNGLINGIQYITMAVIPIAIVDMATKHWFTSKNPYDKGSVELLAEVLGQAVVTLVLLFIVHKLIIAVPTYTGTPISLDLLIIAFALNQGMGDKINVIFTRLQDYWEGKSTDRKDKTKHDKSKVSVSQPISRQGVPTHQASRADYVGNHAQMMPVQSGVPPIVPRSQQQMPQQQQPQQEPATGQSMYGGPSNPLVDANTPGGMQEPLAANSVLGGGFGSAW